MARITGSHPKMEDLGLVVPNTSWSALRESRKEQTCTWARLNPKRQPAHLEITILPSHHRPTIELHDYIYIYICSPPPPKIYAYAFVDHGAWGCTKHCNAQKIPKNLIPNLTKPCNAQKIPKIPKFWHLCPGQDHVPENFGIF